MHRIYNNLTGSWWLPTELSDPVQFEPVGQVTAVFYDVKNQQVWNSSFVKNKNWDNVQLK